MNLVPEQTKVEQGGTLNSSKAEIHDRAGLFTAIIAFGVAMLALGISMTTPARYEDKARTQDQRILELENKLAQVTAEVKAAAPMLRSRRIDSVA